MSYYVLESSKTHDRLQFHCYWSASISPILGKLRAILTKCSIYIITLDSP